MPRQLSQAASRNVLSTSTDAPLLAAIEITHPELAVPARFVNDTEDLFIRGERFFACRFDLTLPDDQDQQLSEAKLEVDNVARELTLWLDRSQGGKGAKCRMLMVLRATPDNLEFDMTMDLSGLAITNLRVSGSLGFKNTLMQSAVAVRFDTTTAPGIY